MNAFTKYWLRLCCVGGTISIRGHSYEQNNKVYCPHGAWILTENCCVSSLMENSRTRVGYCSSLRYPGENENSLQALSPISHFSTLIWATAPKDETHPHSPFSKNSTVQEWIFRIMVNCWNDWPYLGDSNLNLDRGLSQNSLCMEIFCQELSYNAW